LLETLRCAPLLSPARCLGTPGLVGLGLCWLLLVGPASAASLGVMGDSLSDEYAEEGYGSYAENWVEQLELHAGIDLGPTASEAGEPGGSWGEPRRTGYAYNWARSGASSDTLLSDGQHSGLAAHVVSDGLEYAVLAIGANDFYPAGAAYSNIYNGTWSSATIQGYVNQRLANIDAALDVVLPTGVELALVNAPDYGISPTVQSYYPDPLKREQVRSVIAQMNAGILRIAQRRRLVLIDMAGAIVAIFGPHASPNTTLSIGNVAIYLQQGDTSGGGNPTAAFVDDGVHPNTTLQGIIANVVMEALNIAYGANLSLFSEAEILAHRALAYGGSDTLPAQLGDYANYVRNYAFPPPLPALSAPGLALLCAVMLASAFAALPRT